MTQPEHHPEEEQGSKRPIKVSHEDLKGMFFPLTEWELMDDEDEISEEEQVVGDAWKRRGNVVQTTVVKTRQTQNYQGNTDEAFI